MHISEMTFGDGENIDAFGRLKVSNPVTLFDNKQIHDNQPLFWDDSETSGSGTSSSHSTATASTTLSVGATTAGTRLRRTFQRFNYQPGKSLFVMMTTQLSSAASYTGITANVGYFDDNDGVFFSAENGTIYAVIRSSTSGSPVETKIPQSQWSVDKFDGSGPSGAVLDPTKCQIVWFDIEWLGVGEVSFGFVTGGVLRTAHRQDNANALGTVYMSKANLPLSYEISNDGTGAAVSLQHICTTVISEGGNNPQGVIREIDTGTTEITATNAGTHYALLGIRLNSSRLATAVEILQSSVLMTSAGAFHWELYLNPTVDAGTPSWSQITNSSIDTFTGDGTITVSGGTSIGGGYGASTGSGGSAAGATGSAIDNALKLGAAIDGTQDFIVLAVTGLGASETFLGSLTTRELS